MDYEELIFGVATACTQPLLMLLTVGFFFDCINGLLFPKGRW